MGITSLASPLPAWHMCSLLGVKCGHVPLCRLQDEGRKKVAALQDIKRSNTAIHLARCAS